MVSNKKKKEKRFSVNGNGIMSSFLGRQFYRSTLYTCACIFPPDYVHNGFKLTNERSRRYPAQTITDADYAADIALLANTPAQAETLLHSLERATAGIGLHVNAHKTEYMCFNQRGDISALNCCALKLVDKFTYLGSSASST